MTLMTPWGETLDRAHPLPEHPRPQLERETWLSLNGPWEYAITPARSTAAATTPGTWDGEIIVPFSPETALSGVQCTVTPEDVLWYRRRLHLPESFTGQRVLLHFGAVDQDCTVLLDGVEIGSHHGGYLPFTVELTEHLSPGIAHELVVRVRDVNDTSYRSRGKQSSRPHGIWYTAQSGIWQSVWLEAVPHTFIRTLQLTPHLADGEVEVHLEIDAPDRPTTGGGPSSLRAEVTITAPDTGQAVTAHIPVGTPTRIPLTTPVRAWSPEDPFLYDVELRCGDDVVRSYVGMRSVGLGPDAQGRNRLLLNGKPYLHLGLLDQGYWPDGLMTAPSDAAMVFDIKLAKDLGFTMLRKHITIAPDRWYHHCDRLGMLVWQDMVSGGSTYHPAVISAPALTPLQLPDRWHRLFGRADALGRAEFRAELRGTVEHLRAHPSIVAWVPFNEGWGQFDALDITAELRELDPTRLIDHASGWHDQGGGDMVSRHVYFRPYRLSPADARDPRAAVLSEYGGYSVHLPEHAWSDREFGYRRFPSLPQFQRAFMDLQRRQVLPALREGLAAAVYTQLSDVESEVNGLVTYDRKVVKVDRERVRAVHAQLQEAFEHAVRGTAPLPRPVPVSEEEIIAPVSLTNAAGLLNPQAVGFTRTPLHRTDALAPRFSGSRRRPSSWARTKRWEYWAITTDAHIVALVISDIDYAGVPSLWVLDRETGEEISYEAVTPFGRGMTLPPTFGDGSARALTRAFQLGVDEVPGGTRLRARSARIELDVIARRPAGHESLGVVVPWDDRRFQYTVKDAARPADGWLRIDGITHPIPAGQSWAVLDHGRGRWPHRVHWNWGAGTGRLADGRALGIQVGGRWTDGSGVVENALQLDGRLHKISEELVWDYDTENWMAPWRIWGERLDLTLVPFHLKQSHTDLGLVSSHTHQCFGTWSGTAWTDDSERLEIAGITGFAEDVHQRW